MKNDPIKYELWSTVFRINYGLNHTKLDRKYLLINWEKIIPHIDPEKKSTLEYMLQLV